MLLSFTLFWGCAVQADPVSEEPSIICQEPRPEICTMDFHPVCAARDNGIRCITTPCDATDFITYSNNCTACADSRVSAYRDGSCPEKR